ncbi:MAG: Gp49 family protein [Thiolinea sp.]
MSNETQIEQQLQDKGLNAPRLSPELIDSVIESESYVVLPSGKSMICELMLRNGYSVRGESSVVSKENFDENIGRKISRENAREKIWQLEGYLLQQRLWEAQQ